jgi:hypothetical protein
MSATSDDDIWLTTQKPVGCRIEHWNGHRWRIITQRGLTHGLKGFAISATSGQVWVGGYNGNGNSLIARFIATPGHHHWQQAPALQDTVILGLAAAARHNVWAVGASRSRRPVIAHWNGASWRVSATPDVRGGLGAVAVNTANDVLAVGTDTSSATQIAPLALHWDGSTWSRTSAPPLPAADLSTVVGAGHGAFWTAGTNADDPQRTYYLRYSAAGWRAESGPTRTIPGTAGGPDPDQYVEVTGLARVPDTSQVWAVGFDAANDCVSSCGRSRAGDLIIDRYK